MAVLWHQYWLLVPGLLLLALAKESKEDSIPCACTTLECNQMNTRVCNTSRLCFSQYLERKDGGNPITRGCIDSTSTLLCENRKPEALDSSLWPVLVCCNEPMCNLHTSPSFPSSDVETNVQDHHSDSEIPEIEEENVQNREKIDVETELDEKQSTRTEDSVENTYQWTSDPVYIAIAIAALCLIVLLVVLALFVVRQRKTPFPSQTQTEQECCQAMARKHSHSGLHRMMHTKECAGDPYICERFFNSV
ncbi:BMP and activin membrane-bound inhibitor homolog [Ptychodera flava]|uniref:BMP and activin membrane-bound inhibitor homolog n=1 Tax=Ptychodera flava TaxID=63121 RepID=UPI00396A077F